MNERLSHLEMHAAHDGADVPVDRTASRAQEPAALPSQKLASNIKQFCDAVGIGATTTYAEIKARRLKTVWVAGRRLILREDALEWLNEGREKDKRACRKKDKDAAA